MIPTQRSSAAGLRPCRAAEKERNNAMTDWMEKDSRVQETVKIVHGKERPAEKQYGTAPLLSVILPAYNCESYLTQTLESVLSQLTDDCELIVVDDGSSDATAEILKQYEGVKENLQIAYRDHAGVSGARNHGLDMARGEYVAFLDCDDCLEQGFLQKSLPLLEKQAGLYILGIERICGQML